MEDQILYADSTVEVTSDVELSRLLLKKEQRLLEQLQGLREAELRAQERLQRAQRRLQRKRKRVERIQGKLSLVREQLAGLQITDQQEVYREHEVILVPFTEETTYIASNGDSLIQSEQGSMVAQEVGDTLSSETDSQIFDTSVPEQETTSIQSDINDAHAVDGDQQTAREQEYPLPQQEIPALEPVSTAPVETIGEPGSETIPEEMSNIEWEEEAGDSAEISSEANTERRPTKPLQLEEPGPPATLSHDTRVQSAKEAWIAAESAMQHARNAAHGLATSISFLSQTDGLSKEFMEELVRKQADANRELSKAQDAARAAYERFVQAQKDSLSTAGQPADVLTGTSESPSQQEQEHASLPPAEENGLDQTAKLHAARLYTE